MAKFASYAMRAVADASQNTGGELPFYSIDQIADYEINGYWQSIGSPSRSWASDHGAITYNLDALDGDHKTLVKLALASWSELTGLNFKAVSDSADITFNEKGSDSAVTNSSYIGHNLTKVVINVSADWTDTTQMDSYLMQTYVHEIGHSLGLGHTGPYDSDAQYGKDNIFVNDTQQYSIMSYMQQHNYNDESNRYVMTPQMADIFAVQEIYGAGTAREDNTTYGFNASGQEKATAALYDFSNYDQAPALTIYDSGGKDTLDCSGYSDKQLINLQGGTWSDIGGLKGNIGIYATTVIENAIGGSGRDRIIGNDADNVLRGGNGEDTLAGGKGDDTLTGGGKDNLFIFQTGWGNDTITDFVTGADQINLSRFHFDGFDEVRAIAAPSVSDVDNLVLDFGGGDTLTINDFAKSDLTGKDFIL